MEPDAGGMPGAFLRPCLLLLIKEQPGHGYDLVARLKSLRIDDQPTTLYKALRSLEQDGTIRSEWEFSNIGAARRVYQLTPLGDEVLARWVASIEDTWHSLAHYLDRYARTGRREPPA
jgi:PadR family transcriptional regulator, regulatory protein PadR